MFESKINTYNLRNFQDFATKRKKNVKMDLETLNHRQISAIMVNFARKL